MRRRMLKSKIHRATVTAAVIDYEGSISLDTELMKRADIVEWEQVAVLDVENGARFETYVIAGEAGQVQLNGAAARLVTPGDRVIVLTYADIEESDVGRHEPVVVHVDHENRAVERPESGGTGTPRRSWVESDLSPQGSGGKGPGGEGSRA